MYFFQELLETSDWYRNPDIADRLKTPLVRLCTRYMGVLCAGAFLALSSLSYYTPLVSLAGLRLAPTSIETMSRENLCYPVLYMGCHLYCSVVFCVQEALIVYS